MNCQPNPQRKEVVVIDDEDEISTAHTTGKTLTLSQMIHLLTLLLSFT